MTGAINISALPADMSSENADIAAIAAGQNIAHLPLTARLEASPKMTRKNSLAIWHGVTVRSVVNNTPDLSFRQLAVLMTVYLDDRPQTVRSLAKKLCVTKAVITRAVDKLVKHGYVKRAPDLRDKRSIILTRTPSGIHYLSNFADIIQSEFAR